MNLLRNSRVLPGIAATSIALVAWGSGAAWGSTGSANDSKSATALVSSALQNAQNAGWVHEKVNLSVSGHKLSMDNEIGKSKGRQVITPDAGHATVIVIGGMAYIKGDASALTNYFGFPSAVSSKESGKWISFRPSDSGYSSVTGAATLKSDFNELRPKGPQTKGQVTEINGVRVIPIQGAVAASSGSTTTTLYVTAEGRVLPVELQAKASAGTETIMWNHWGRAAHFVAPSRAVTIASLKNG